MHLEPVLDLSSPITAIVIAHLVPTTVPRMWGCGGRPSQYLRERFLSHRLWPTYDDILDACCAAWTRLRGEPGALPSKSV
jgi:hypothetical protein